MPLQSIWSPALWHVKINLSIIYERLNVCVTTFLRHGYGFSTTETLVSLETIYTHTHLLIGH